MKNSQEESKIQAKWKKGFIQIQVVQVQRNPDTNMFIVQNYVKRKSYLKLGDRK